MKTQFVEMLQEGVRVNDYFVAVHKDLRTQPNGAKFLGMVFKDRTGEIGGILWNNAVAVAKLFEVGDVVNVKGNVSSYQDRLQVRVEQVLPLKEGEFDPVDLVWSPEEGETYVAKLGDLLGAVAHPWLRQLIDAFWNDAAFMEQLRAAAAGKKWHHAYRGGLIRHCYEIARIALTMCELFPNLDKDTLLAAVFFHDAGKVQEMRHDLLIEYTTAGKLLGHVALGAELVGRGIDRIEGFPDTLRMQLLHCILAHHGELTNGSPVVPKTLEAMVLYHCDNMDAQVDAISEVLRETATKGQNWSEYLPLIERQVWTKRTDL